MNEATTTLTRAERHVGVVDGDVVCGGDLRAALVTQHLLDLQTVASPDVLAQFVQDFEDRNSLLRRPVGGQRDRAGCHAMLCEVDLRWHGTPTLHDLPALGRTVRRCTALSSARALASLSR